MNWVLLGQQLWYGLVNGGSYIIFAIGLTLIFGMMKVVNMAHGEIYMLGAMLVYSSMTFGGMNFFLAAALSIVLVGGVGVIVNRVAIQPLLAPARLSIFLSTMALSWIMLHSGVAIWTSFPKTITTPFTEVVSVAGVKMTEQSIMLLSLAAVAIVLLQLLLTKTGLGKTMMATSQTMVGAQLVGINVTRIFDYTMFLAAALAALAGILMAPVACAHPYMGQPMLIMGFAVVIVGGMGNIRGTILVGLIIGLTEALFGQYVSMYFRLAYIYGFMIVVLLVRPQGLFTKRI